jgi:hypothetical protein
MRGNLKSRNNEWGSTVHYEQLFFNYKCMDCRNVLVNNSNVVFKLYGNVLMSTALILPCLDSLYQVIGIFELNLLTNVTELSKSRDLSMRMFSLSLWHGNR